MLNVAKFIISLGVSFPVCFNAFVIMYTYRSNVENIEVNIHCKILNGVYYTGQAKLASRNKGTTCTSSWDLFVSQTCFITLTIFQHIGISSLRCCCHYTVVLLN